MGRKVGYVRTKRIEYKKAARSISHLSEEEFNQKWTETFKKVREFVGDTKSLSKSRITYEYLTNKGRPAQTEKGETVLSDFEKYLEGENVGKTRTERAKNLVLNRFEKIRSKYKDTKLEEIFSAYEDKKITYEELKRQVKDWKEKSSEYSAEGSD